MDIGPHSPNQCQRKRESKDNDATGSDLDDFIIKMLPRANWAAKIVINATLWALYLAGSALVE